MYVWLLRNLADRSDERRIRVSLSGSMRQKPDPVETPHAAQAAEDGGLAEIQTWLWWAEPPATIAFDTSGDRPIVRDTNGVLIDLPDGMPRP